MSILEVCVTSISHCVALREESLLNHIEWFRGRSHFSITVSGLEREGEREGRGEREKEMLLIYHIGKKKTNLSNILAINIS